MLQLLALRPSIVRKRLCLHGDVQSLADAAQSIHRIGDAVKGRIDRGLTVTAKRDGDLLGLPQDLHGLVWNSGSNSTDSELLENIFLMKSNNGYPPKNKKRSESMTIVTLPENHNHQILTDPVSFPFTQ